MEEKGIINTNQFIWLLFCIITSFTVLHTPGILIIQSGRDAGLSIILAWILDVLLAVVYAYMGIRFPGQNMAQYSMTILGKRLGKVVGFMFPLFFFLVSVLLQSGFAILLHVAFFPKTSVETILFCASITVAYAVLKGVEVMGRVCEFLGPIFLISLIALFVLVTPDLHLENLKPQLEHGLYPTISGAFLIISFIGICIIMGVYIPICDHPENGFFSKFSAVSIGSITIFLIIIASIGVFSITQSKNMFSPSLRLARYIHMTTFFQRLEVVWLMIAIGALIISSAEMIWASALQTAQVMGLKSYKPLILPTVLVSFVLAATSFRNSVDLFNFINYSYPIIAMFVETGLEMALFFIALIFKKKG
ncbi:endospore germination permease [Clostridium sp. YIM B02505]|uniref:Endospore germination permease n=1 Tax=Clostridium yunnanense TaxID=2800325 RepID=A0ABS1ERK2_9CLOT|nr:endospore germination permease [Clostridium yunnanense]MBK1811903.1 endospore germination permease [Clostridium yunnanense]